jgi:hypothetical protein
MLRPFNYVVGHGFFMRLREFVEVNYMPQYAPNEDAAFGFTLPYYGIWCEALEGCDVATTPSSIGVLLKQQASWILGPAQSYKYAAYAWRSRLCRNIPVLVADFLKAGWDAVVWVLGPTLFLWSAIASAMGVPAAPWLLCAFLVYLTACTLPLIHLAATLFPASKRPHLAFCVGVLAMPVWYVLHGFAGFWGLVRPLHVAMLGKPFLKHKTERP